jgi:glycosyltransferase involved in cell wall biosynthesis
MISKTIAIICDYEIRPDRIGGMDRFFVAFDTRAKSKGYSVKWFFKGRAVFDFYKALDVTFTSNSSVEALFLNHLRTHSERYDYVITHFTELCSPFYKKVKLITNAYCISVDHNPRPLEGFSLKKRLKLKVKGLLYGRYIDLFIGVSNYTVRHIIKDYGRFLKSKVQVIYNGIDTKVFKKRVQPNTNRFIVASHLRLSKGIQDLLEALSFLTAEEKHRLHIDIYGEGPMEMELRQQCTELDLDAFVTFKGSSPNLPVLFCNYAFMIQPTYMECFSLSILESLSANVPIITTQVGGNLEIIKDSVNGFVFNAGDITGLSDIISDIISGKKSILFSVDTEVNKSYYLKRMVDDHLNILSCT